MDGWMDEEGTFPDHPPQVTRYLDYTRFITRSSSGGLRDRVDVIGEKKKEFLLDRVACG
jgi:hypothetical protein